MTGVGEHNDSRMFGIDELSCQTCVTSAITGNAREQKWTDLGNDLLDS